MKKLVLTMAIAGTLTGCAGAPYHSKAVQSDAGDRITVGKVQREVRVGMSSAQVAEVLGSPNVVSTDDERREVWIYDKIATDVTTSESGAGLKFLTPGHAGASSTSQRTLTVVIKFDESGKVRDFAYHTSRF